MTYRPVRKAAVLALAALIGAVIALTDSGGSASASAAIRRATTTTSPDCGATVRKSYFKTWTCTFADNFDGSALDPTKWQAITTASNGYAGGEACYVDSPNNISVAGGYLTLTARQEAAPFTCQSPKGNFTTQYTTGQVATYGKFFQTYGRFAVRAKFPAATISGLQSTLWLWPESPLTTGAVGEIDFAEWYSYQADKITPFLHYIYDPSTTNYTTGVNVATKTCPVIDASAFHEYAVEWSSSTIKIYIDGQTCLTDKYVPYGTNPFNQPYFIALSQALGLSPNNFYPGITPLPATTTIDWVRAWK
jgi:beta-glucanase (GH16 family)